MAGEFEFIDAFVAALPHPRPPVGPGDDCALPPRPKGRLCVTTDATVENVHFTRARFGLAEVGYKALASNLSDLASMGAKPTWWLCALGVPAGFGLAEARELAAGMRPLAKRFGLKLLGGNVSASPVLSVTLTLAGEAARPLLRSGARPGDALYVCGALGDARAGLDLVQGSAAARTPAELALLEAQLRPMPRVAEGLVAARFARAAVDVSDGLLQDLGHVCRASRVAARLSTQDVPVSPALREVAGGRAPLLALLGGEDYALLLAVPKAREAAFLKAMRRARLDTHRLGTFARGQGVWLDGVRQQGSGGFDHLARRGF